MKLLPSVEFKRLEKDIQIEFSKYLNKKEKNLLNIVDIKGRSIPISLDILYNIFEVKTQGEVEKILSRLLNKNLILSSNETSYMSKISILQSFYIIEKNLILTFSDEIKKSFMIGTDYEKLGINKILTFREKFTYRLYQYIRRTKKNKINLSIEKIRELLEIKETYKRFYDIEKNLLKPIFKDLEDNGKIILKYTKVKSGDFKSAKILGILIEKIDVEDNSKIIINEIMGLIKKEVINFSEIYSLILKYLSNYGEEYVRKKVDYTLKNYKDNFDYFLKRSLENNFEVIEAEPNILIEKEFKNLFELHSEILKLLRAEKKDNSYSPTYLFNSKFLIKIYNLKDDETLICEEKDFTLKIHYKKRERSMIKLYLK